MFWLLLLLPVLVFVYILIKRRRHKYAVRYSSVSLIKESIGSRHNIRRYIPPFLFLFCLAATIFALSRPIDTVVLPSEQGTVILTIDVSLSMLASDIEPTRLEAAESAAIALVGKEPKDVRIGVVSFSGTTAILQAPTTDHVAITNSINRLQPQESTAIGSGILTSLDAIFEQPGGNPAPVSQGAISLNQLQPAPPPLPAGTYAPAVVVLLTDGQNNTGPEPLDIIDQAKNRGVRIYTVGVGSPGGANLIIGRSMVRVSLDEQTLKQVAEQTDGRYFNAENETELYNIYENLGKQIVFEKHQTELTSAFTGLAMVLGLIAGTLSLLWSNRP